MDSTFTSDHHAKTQCFFKIIVSEISSKSKLVIPKMFVRKCGEELQGRVLLKAPGGATWPVTVERKSNKVLLGNGWPEFATFYSLCFGHCILFRYQGNCNFKVVICDTSATEIDYPIQHEKRQRGSESDEVRDCKTKRVHSAGCKEACHIGDSLKRKMQKEKFAEASSNINTSSTDEEESGDSEKSSHANGIQHDKLKEPINLEVDLDNNPFFRVIMQPSYVGQTCGLHVKKAYLNSYIRKGVEVLILQIGVKTWLVKCSVCSYRIRLGSGWKQFAADNALAVGDVCVFELVNPSKKLLEVVIIRGAPASSSSKRR